MHAFVCDADHHFVEYSAMLAALRPGGQLVVVDVDRVPGKSREWLLSHVRAGKDAVRGEIEEAGFWHYPAAERRATLTNQSTCR
jgi:predicted methyltransferase